MSESMTSNLIAKLSVRFNNENDLSDLVWTLCEVLGEFKDLFISSFFPELKGKYESIELQREFGKGNSRPDFYFVFEKQEYLIEVKKWDTNDHFEQYIKDFPNAKRGWIAIYKVSPPDDFTIKTWEDFYDLLSSEINLSNNSMFLELAEGFRQYLKTVCSIIKFQVMHLNGLQSLYFFNNMLGELIERERPGIKATLNLQPKSFFKDRSGSFFWLKKRWQRTNLDSLVRCVL